jgi:hypothetical protein
LPNGSKTSISLGGSGAAHDMRADFVPRSHTKKAMSGGRRVWVERESPNLGAAWWKREILVYH